MTFLDRIIRWWRVSVALRALKKSPGAVFDIGCDDGYLLKKIDGAKLRLDRCDPRLAIGPVSDNSRLLSGFFPAVIQDAPPKGLYDAVFALAVFEHFTEADLTTSALAISRMLTDEGQLIVTVPGVFVDKILDVLLSLKLIHGQALEEHHGFDPKTLPVVFGKHLKLVQHRKFQFGLNNLFVFQKL